jgi:hypothetical protein
MGLQTRHCGSAFPLGHAKRSFHMCEYCIEGLAIEIARKLASGENPVLEPSLRNWISVRCFLQECDELLPAILEYESTLDEAFSRLAGYPPGSKVTIVFANSGDEILMDAPQNTEFRFAAVHALLQTVFCRIVEEIVKRGFESEICHNLLSNSLVQRIIEHQSQIETVFDNRLFTPQSSLRHVLWDDVFLDKRFWNETINESDFLQDCRNLVKNYVYWCHLEKNLNKEVIREECDILSSMYPHLFFAFLIATRHQTSSAYRDTLYKLVRIDPNLGPFGMLLWLQCKTALALHELLGLAVFLPYKIIRPVLVYYLLVKNKLSASEKETLRDILSNSEELKRQQEIQHRDKASEEFMEKQPIYAKTELMIMEYLA